MDPETTPPAATAPLAGGVPDRTPAASPAGVWKVRRRGDDWIIAIPGTGFTRGAWATEEGAQGWADHYNEWHEPDEEPEPGGATSAWEHHYG